MVKPVGWKGDKKGHSAAATKGWKSRKGRWVDVGPKVADPSRQAKMYLSPRQEAYLAKQREMHRLVKATGYARAVLLARDNWTNADKFLQSKQRGAQPAALARIRRAREAIKGLDTW